MLPVLPDQPRAAPELHFRFARFIRQCLPAKGGQIFLQHPRLRYYSAETNHRRQKYVFEFHTVLPLQNLALRLSDCSKSFVKKL